MRAFKLVVGAIACLGLVGCDAFQHDEPDSDPSPETTTDSTPDTSDEVAFDPCELIPREQIEELGLYRESAGEQFHGLSLGREQIVDCRVDHYETFSFGYKGVDDGEEVWRLVSNRPPEDIPEIDAIDDLGDEAYYTEMGMQRLLAIRVGDEQLFIRDNTDEEIDDEDMFELGRTMVENLPNDFEHIAVVLPPECPAADSEPVTELVGTVAQARGASTDGSLALMCRYVGESGTRINAEILAITQENAEDLIDHRAQDSEELEVEGHTIYLNDDVTDNVSLASADKDGTYASIDVTARVGSDDGEPDHDAALALMVELLDQ